MLNLIDSVYTEYQKAPRVTNLGLLSREEIIRFILDYVKDIARWMRRRENIVSTLGWVISVEVFEEIIERVRGEKS